MKFSEVALGHNALRKIVSQFGSYSVHLCLEVKILTPWMCSLVLYIVTTFVKLHESNFTNTKVGTNKVASTSISSITKADL